MSWRLSDSPDQLRSDLESLRAVVLAYAVYAGDVAPIAGCGAELFGWNLHREIFDTIVKLHLDGHPVNPLTVGNSVEVPGARSLVAKLNEVWLDQQPGSRSVPVLVDRLADLAARELALRRTNELKQALEAGNDAGGLAESVLEALSSSRRSEEPDEVQWEEFWRADDPGPQWIAEPLIAAGRGHLFHAKHKVGKSLLALDLAATVATGRAILRGANPAGPRHVLYVDWEMTPADLRDRLESFGYGPETDLSHLHYCFHPHSDPLDTARGGQRLVAWAEACCAELVVLDPFQRVVQGDENDADTIRAFYRHTGQPLKARGIAMVRLDHDGKDSAKGSRGSSAKGDDVDIIWAVKPSLDGLELESTARMPWVPKRVALSRDENGRHTLEHRPEAYSAGTEEIAARLEALDVPYGATIAEAMEVLKDNGGGKRKAVVGDALRWRRAHRPHGKP